MATFGFLVLLSAAAGASSAAETIPPGKVAQLKRLEPLTPGKIQVFVDSGQLTPAQAELVRRYTDASGILRWPATPPVAPVAPPVTPVAPPVTAAPAVTPAGSLPRRGDGSLDVLAYIHREDQAPFPALPQAEHKRLEGNLKAFSHLGESERDAIRRDLRAVGPAAVPLIAAAYLEPADLAWKLSLWKAVAGPANPRAAGYIAQTHRAAMQVANPLLIPYDKDAGWLRLRRHDTPGQVPPVWYSSRELRDMIVDLEKYTSHCTGVRAAVYLMDVYAARYRGVEAPMRDDSRDRDCLLTACGGSPKHFDDGDPRTWGCALPPVDRVLIADRLAPYLNARSGDLREIARYSLLIVNGQADRHLNDFFNDAHKNWPAFERWWTQRREELLAQVR